MKRLVLALFLILLVLPVGTITAQPIKPDSQIKVYLHGEQLNFDISPIQTRGTTLVQFTTIFKALGLNYSWDDRTKTVHGSNEQLKLSLTIDNLTVMVNDKAIALPISPMALNGRTLVPLRFVSESTGLEVTWDSENKTIDIYEKGSKPERKSKTGAIMFGAEMLNSHEQVQKKLLQQAYSPFVTVKNEYLEYSNVDVFNLNMQAFFRFSGNKLSHVQYIYGNQGFDGNPISVFKSLISEMEKELGVATSYQIYEFNYKTGEEKLSSNQKLSEEKLLASFSEDLQDGSLKELTYRIQAAWTLNNTKVVTRLYPSFDHYMMLSMDISNK